MIKFSFDKVAFVLIISALHASKNTVRQSCEAVLVWDCCFSVGSFFSVKNKYYDLLSGDFLLS